MSGDGANGTFIIEDGAKPAQTMEALERATECARRDRKDR